MYNHVTTIRLTPALRDWVRDYAIANELKPSVVIRMAVKRFMASQQQPIKRDRCGQKK